MIWYACKKCGKRSGKADHQAGVLVFCECGFGNRVPLASTVPEPTAEESPAPIPLPLPPLAPPNRPARPSIPLPPRDLDDRRRGRPEEPPPPPFRPKPRREYRRVNPKFCLNHDETPTEHTCAHCRLPFCSKCVVELQGEIVCGPCKNFKVRGMQRPSRIAPLATVAAVVALVAGPVCFCLSFLGVVKQAQSGNATGVLFGLVALLPPVGVLALSLYALKEIETKPRIGGRSLAMSGTVVGLVGILWSVTVVMVMIVKLIQEQ